MFFICISGVYAIANKINNNTYIGISSNISRRWEQHKYNLIKGYKNKELPCFYRNNPRVRHHQLYLQLEFNEFYKIYKEDIWDDIYDFNLILPISNKFYSKNILYNLEDSIILKLREISDGYYQMTNEELKDKYEIIEINGSKKIISVLENYKNDIIKDYITNKLSYREIAKKYNSNSSSIMRLLRKYEVVPRDNSSGKIKFDICKFKEDIIDMYINKSLNATQIGKIYGVQCATINSYLKKWGISLKSMSELIAGVNLEDYKTDITDMYINQKLSMKNIGIHFGVSKTTISRYFMKWGIPTKDYYHNRGIVNNIK